jgi:transposase
MRDIELYQRVLGLEEPWRVEQVKLDVVGKRVDIELSHAEAVTWRCPHCQRELACYDHVSERTWRHLDTCQFQTHLRARLPRVKCPEHGVVQVAAPWAAPHGRFTLLFERWIIDVLQATDTITGTCELLGLSWDEVFGVMQRAVARGRQRKREQATDEPVQHVGVDEKAFRKGHSYMTVVCDLDEGVVEHVADDRKAESLGEYFESLTDEQRQAIQAVAMDMWPAYIKATLEHLPLAADKIVFDRFHILKLMNEAVDKVRKQEHRRLQAAGDDRLKGTKYLWLYAKEHLPDRHQPTFNTLRAQNLRTSRAWAIKETLRSLWDYRSATWARKFFAQWFGWARRSRLEPIKKVAMIFQRHLANILTYCRHPITNGVAEGLNSRIMTIKRKACGYRNRENFKTAIYFFCGGLNLYPQ